MGGVSSVVESGKNGLLVDNPEDVNEVARKIQQLLLSPRERERMGEKGVELGREKFSWDMVAGSFEELFEACASRNP